MRDAGHNPGGGKSILILRRFNMTLSFILLPIALVVFSANGCTTESDRRTDDELQLTFLRQYMERRYP